MPHFSEDLSAEDPETLRRLRTLLRGEALAPRRLPTLEERFGVAAREVPGTARSPAPQPRRSRRPVTT
jgi:hypothetical protein